MDTTPVLGRAQRPAAPPRDPDPSPGFPGHDSYDTWRRDVLSRAPLPGSPPPGWLPLPSPGDYDW